MSSGIWTRIIALCLFCFLLVTTMKFQWTFTNKLTGDQTSNEKKNATTRIHINGTNRTYFFLTISQQLSCSQVKFCQCFLVTSVLMLITLHVPIRKVSGNLPNHTKITESTYHSWLYSGVVSKNSYLKAKLL